ncbi:MAG: hypothetical protein FJX64_04415 [Alphaproteobacteria bacterium]|nr:hypothetical protein [Alphaproteobacteria bacterium]MBM4437549.1 hypothetical protein [Actinomycetota bacterium]
MAIRLRVFLHFLALGGLSLVAGLAAAQVWVPFCDEGLGGLCVSRDPIDTYLVVWIEPTGQVGLRTTSIEFRAMSRSECLNLPQRAQCFRVGVYTASQQRYVRERGDEKQFGGPNSPTVRQYFQNYLPRSDAAPTLSIDLQMSTVAGFLATTAMPGGCHSTHGLEGKAIGDRRVYSDCAYLWLEPVTK